MPKVHFVKKARKAWPQAGIEKGQSYYWWAFMQGGRGGPRHFSKVPPRRSQLVASEFLRAVAEIQERLDAMSPDPGTMADERDAVIEEIRALGEEQMDKHGNMPEGLQQGQTGELLEGRADACEDWAGELESVDLPEEKDSKDEKDEDFEQRCEDALVELQGCEYQGE